jgi:hypothetical protein
MVPDGICNFKIFSSLFEEYFEAGVTPIAIKLQ